MGNKERKGECCSGGTGMLQGVGLRKGRRWACSRSGGTAWNCLEFITDNGATCTVGQGFLRSRTHLKSDTGDTL